VLSRAVFGEHLAGRPAETKMALAPGRYVADAVASDGRKATATFEVRRDGEPPVVVKFEP
jgi:hypothetical protein